MSSKADSLKKIASFRENLPAFARDGIDEEALLEEIEAARDTIRAVELPRLYQIEITSRCNLECTFCPRTTDLLANQLRDLDADMSLERFRCVLNAMPWLEGSCVELYHFGESFMLRDLHLYVRSCRSRNIGVVLATNLLPANDEKVDRVFDTGGIRLLVVDVDYIDERYEGVRVNGSLALLRQRLRYVLSHPQRPYTVVQTIMLDGAQQEAYTEAEFGEWVGRDIRPPDEIRYKFLDSFRGEIGGRVGTLRAEDLCREPFYGFVVQVTGDVVPCCRDWAGQSVMGNVFEQDVLEIWNGERYRDFREQMKSTTKPSLCRHCPEGRLFNARSQPSVQINMLRVGRETP